MAPVRDAELDADRLRSPGVPGKYLAVERALAHMHEYEVAEIVAHEGVRVIVPSIREYSDQHPSKSDGAMAIFGGRR
eukprot:6197286-Pleurochrysis_carterae.AAC.6